MDPFETLVSIAERSVKTATKVPSKTDAQTHWMGLGFWLLEERFVVPMSEVVELMKVPRATHLPGVRNWIYGIANVRGRLMTLVDLPLYFGQSSKRARAQRRIFAVDGEDFYYGMIVDESMGMQHFSSEAEIGAKHYSDERFNNYVRGTYHATGIDWPEISLAAIASDLREEKLSI